ncbi:stress-inducible protein STI1-like [Trypanosoma rangeli]|uniref:Stress-inducible protein STI1-like n=1 Tax=Trypanosoma rangeli TaxID=5698 RepID=A0A422NB01_TRYRA|nr:stress-inducible protein STI1-like [Trypanosoma rangeli]RNF02654.1 stress-inducible protein STI1-like [Trypanosoma rangeli]|eukprot:RNF02654.1 stress-inducible protein STI1-like [Trypanosoma rangeli]
MGLDELKLQGNEAFKAKKYEDAIHYYTKAIDLSPQPEAAAALYSNRAACWQNTGNAANALKDAESCILLRPSWIKGHYRKGTAFESMQKYDEALKAFQQAAKLEPGNEEIADKLQQLVLMLKERNEKASPGACRTPDEAKNIGNSLFAAGNFERAMLFYSRAIELSPEGNAEKANYYANRAACHQQTRNYHLVINDCDKALVINPTHVKALLRRAIAYEGLESWSKALNDYNQVNRAFPGMPAVSQGVLRCQRALRG